MRVRLSLESELLREEYYGPNRKCFSNDTESGSWLPARASGAANFFRVYQISNKLSPGIRVLEHF